MKESLIKCYNKIKSHLFYIIFVILLLINICYLAYLHTIIHKNTKFYSKPNFINKNINNSRHKLGRSNLNPEQNKGAEQHFDDNNYEFAFGREMQNIINIEKEINKKFEQIQSLIDKNKNAINIDNKNQTTNYLHFSNSSNDNGKIFNYIIDINGNEINGKIESSDEQILKDLEGKLNIQNIKLEKKDGYLQFNGNVKKSKEILEIFNITIN